MTLTKPCFFQSSELPADAGKRQEEHREMFLPYAPAAVLILEAGQESLSPGDVSNWKEGFSEHVAVAGEAAVF